MPTYITDLINRMTERLQTEYHTERTAHANAWHLLEKITGQRKTKLLVRDTIELSQDEHAILERWISDITDHHKPIQYILGTVPFIDTEIIVEPPILIPRPETETWCYRLIEQLREHGMHQFRLLDLCTGSGCVAIAIAHAFPEAQIYAADISEQALQLAQRNATHNNVTIHCLQSNVFEQIPTDHQFDIIVANPPYIAHNEWNHLHTRITQWEDPASLVAAEDGLSIIQDIAHGAPQHLAPSQSNVPHLWIEIGYDQGCATRQILEQAGFHDINIGSDLNDHDRIVTGFMR